MELFGTSSTFSVAGSVEIVPTADAKTFVNGKLITEAVLLQSGELTYYIMYMPVSQLIVCCRFCRLKVDTFQKFQVYHLASDWLG